MKKLMIGILTGFLFLAAASHESYANQCGCGSEMGMQGGARMMHHGPGFTKEAEHFPWQKLMGLGLSDKQIDALKAIRNRVAKDTIKKRADLQLARVELREMLDKDSVDMGAVEASLKKAEAVKTDLHLSHIKAMEEIKAILTPEQRKKFKEDLRAGFMMHKEKCGNRHASMPPVQNDEAHHGTDEQ